MDKVRYTITIRANDRQSQALERIESVCREQTGLEDLSIPLDVDCGAMVQLLSSCKSYLQGAYDIDLHLIGYCPPDNSPEEWTFTFRWNKAAGWTQNNIITYDVLFVPDEA